MRSYSIVLVCLGFTRSIAFADGDAPAPAPAPTPAIAPAAPAPAEVHDGMRFRNGVSFAAGQESVSQGGPTYKATMFGLDWRTGLQVNNMFAVYLQSHLSFGSFATGGAVLSGLTGTLSETVMGEVTLIDKLFVGAGAGYGVLNNPNGPDVQFRIGGYPLMHASSTEARRRGLMVGADLRLFYVGQGISANMVTVSVGYEKF